MVSREAGKAWRLILGLPKTLLFNFYYFPISRAWRLPVLVSHRMKLVLLGGEVSLAGEAFGAVRLGLPDVDIFPDNGTSGVWKVNGRVKLGENVRIGPGTRVVCEGELEIGDNVYINAGVSLFCVKRIAVGRDSLVAWNCTLMDHDFHALHDAEGQCINAPGEIVLEERVWLGSGVTVTKGARLASGVVVAAGTVMYGEIAEPDCIVAGNPPRVIRRGVFRNAAI
jgi:UDP-3-O-[3-hydroxymyristoyl] glucosamine N-acyltransferase